MSIGINKLNKKITTTNVSRITLTNNDIKDIKVIKSLKNMSALFKGTAEKKEARSWVLSCFKCSNWSLVVTAAVTVF